MWSFFRDDSPKKAANQAPSSGHHEYGSRDEQPKDPHDSLAGCFLGALAGKPNGSPMCREELKDVREFDQKSSNCPCLTPPK